MVSKLSFLAGLGTGYVLGARAGCERYNQLTSKARDLWQDPAVQDKVGQAQQAAKEQAQEAQHAVTEKAKEKAHDAQEAVKSKIGTHDESSDGPATTAPPTTAAPAGPSVTSAVPDGGRLP